MLQKIIDKDRRIVQEYLLLEPSYNVFMIGDIENFGFECEFQDVWADFNDLGNIVAARIYKKMGFRDVGRWAMASVKNE